MRKVLVIAGPTGSGKSDLGILAARKFDGEIISGDSIQVYKGLDIGSAKVSREEQKMAIHHLIDILDINQHYSVADFQKQARYLIEEISGRNKLPILVGGTGYYLKSCLYDYVFPEGTEEISDEIYRNRDNASLHAELKIKDPQEAEKIHVNNRKRLIRALKMADGGYSRSMILEQQKHEPVYDAFVCGLTLPRTALYERINLRVDRMMEAGLYEEVKSLYEKDPAVFSYQAMQGIGYREWREHFENGKSREEVTEEIKKHSRQFSKRQYTWLNHQMEVNWFDITDPAYPENVMKEIEKWR